MRIRESKLPAAHWRVPAARCLVGAALAGQKKFDEAEPLLQNGLEGMAAARIAPPELTGWGVDRIVALYVATGKPAEAEAWRQKRIPRE